MAPLRFATRGPLLTPSGLTKGRPPIDAARMRSKASIDGHPVHPALIPFPFAFLTGGFAFDLVGRVLAWPAWWETGHHLVLAGLAMAVVAAIPGFIDYARTVPPQSSAHGRATRHMLLVLGAVTAFVVAALLRAGAAAPPTLAVLVVEGAGVALLMAGGSLGGELVYRDQISIDNRFPADRPLAEAIVRSDLDGLIVGATSTELGVDQMKLLRVNGKRIVLARTATGHVAFADACGHEGGSLAAGTMICGTVQCPWHGSQFDARTGCVRAGPATRRLDVYPVEEADGVVRIRL